MVNNTTVGRHSFDVLGFSINSFAFTSLTIRQYLRALIRLAIRTSGPAHLVAGSCSEAKWEYASGQVHS